jgi:hypothetical protein
MNPSIGRIVLYSLTFSDAKKINGRRVDGTTVKLLKAAGKWPDGAQAHVGTHVQPYEIYPMIITRVRPHRDVPTLFLVSGQTFLNGSDTFWVEDVYQAEAGMPSMGCWSWPPRI